MWVGEAVDVKVTVGDNVKVGVSIEVGVVV